MRKNRKLISALLGLVLAVVAYAGWKSHQKAELPQQGEPQKTAEEILAERARQASTHLDTPLGKAIAQKDWVGFESQFKPATQFHELAEIVRALFIENRMKDYNPTEQEKLLELCISTLEQVEEKNLSRAGLLITQIQRLPSPKHTQPAYEKLAAWARDSHAPLIKRRLGIEKLVLQDAAPDPQIVKLYQNTFTKNEAFYQERAEWMQRIEDVRNEKVRLSLIQTLSKNFNQIPSPDRAGALAVLSHHLDTHPQETKALALSFFNSQNEVEFEASLRAIPYLDRAKLLSASEKEKIIKKLTDLPPALKSPFSDVKSKEILQSFKPE